MSTYTIHPQGRHHGATAWTLQHPLASTIAALVGAVAVGVLVGILFSMLFAGTEAAPQHRAGGHAQTTVAAKQAAATAVAAAEVTGHTVIASTTSGTRSPARGGFAVGRTAGAGSGFIVLQSGTRAPVRGGFPGRSLGAGHAPAVAMARAQAGVD